MRLGLGLRPYRSGIPSWVRPGAGVDLDLAGGRYYGGTPDTALSLSRGGTAYSKTSSNLWLPFSGNTKRLTDLGLLLEESRPNYIRNNAMQGAVAGSSLPTNWTATAVSGLSWSVDAIGVEDGVDFIDLRLSGTAAETGQCLVYFETTTGISASNTQNWTISQFARPAGGSLSNISAIRSRAAQLDSGGSVLSALDAAEITLSAGPLGSSRTQAAITTNEASIANLRPYLRVTVGSTGAVDLTFRIGWPQSEPYAFVSSPIRTTGSAVTRMGDALTAIGPAATIMNGSAWSFIMEHAGSPNGIAVVLGSFSVFFGNVSGTLLRHYNGSTTLDKSIPTMTGPSIIGFAQDGSGRSIAGNGSSAGSDTGAGGTWSTKGVGNAGNSNQSVFTWVRRLTWFPFRLTSTDLVTRVTPP